ncbi:MAG: VOC family protein [Alphaproteobacteria bacterium]|nr:VOC family protein [Alphaproteobacteria bacterium]
MAHSIDGIDHPVVAVRDLAAARERARKLGFTTTPRRRFASWGNANFAVMLRHTYIELLGIVDPNALPRCRDIARWHSDERPMSDLEASRRY